MFGGELPRPLDLAAYPYWLALGVGLLGLTPITSAGLRKWLLAALNLGFLGLLLGPLVVPVVLAIALITALTRLRGTAGLLALGSLLLFVVHKSPALAWGPLNPLLSALGYSFIALRLLDLARTVHEGRAAAPDFAACVNYLVPFHMLAAGPIQTYDEFVRQPPVPEAPTAERVLTGLERLSQGLFKKAVLAQTIEKLFLTGFQGTDTLYTFAEIQLYYVWVYLDFSGYSDIAVGTGTLLGLQTPENFRNPLSARDIIDFWERWHISLSRFIRDNVFIPVHMTLARLWRGRSPLLAGVIAYIVAFSLCGLWHGLSARFLAWGLYHALGIIVCKTYQEWMLQRWGRKGRRAYLANQPIRWIMTVITFEFVAISLAMIA